VPMNGSVSRFSLKRGQSACQCDCDSLSNDTEPDCRCMLQTDVYQNAEIGQAAEQ
jgi:hypothetical protein